jgi:predicted dehydrogenase
VIGQPQMLTANLGYLLANVERMLRPELAGGALLDLGVYAINFASMFFGNAISSIQGNAILTDTGVDAQNSITLSYEDGRMAVLCSSFRGLSDRRGIIYGDKGFLEVQNINNFETVDVYNRDRKHIAHYDAPHQITGYEYEVEAAVRAIWAGEYECPEMPHHETLLMMQWMDELRRQWGVKYPGE